MTAQAAGEADALDPLVPVMATARLRSYPKHDQGGAAHYMPVSTALTSTFTTDAHFAGYSVPPIKRRLTKTVTAIGGVDVHMVAITFDVDGPGHKATDEWWEGERLKLFDLFGAHPGGFAARSRGGYKITYLLERPIFIRDEEDARAWRALYVSFCKYLARWFNIIADRSCKEWNRLFRLPHATRDNGVGPEQRETIGDATNIGTWHCDLTSDDFALDEEKNTAKVRETPRATGYTGPGRLIGAFDRRGWLGDEIETGKYAARCPWESSHTSGESFDSSTVIFEADAARGDLGWFHCSHGHCEARTVKEVIALFSDEELSNPPKCGETWPSGKVCAASGENLFSDGKCKEHSTTPEAIEARSVCDDREAPPRDEVEAPAEDAPPSDTTTPRRKRKPRPPKNVAIEETLTDAANGAEFARDHAGDLYFVADSQKWKEWDGRRYADAVEGALLRRAKKTAHRRLREATQIVSEHDRKPAVEWALASAGLPRLRAMITLGASEPAIETRAAELDRDPFALNLQNGILDLKTGKLRPHARAAMMTRLVPIGFDPTAECPRWRRFLTEALAGDDELIQFLQRAVGYSLTGDTREHALFLLCGSGCNGKSIFIEILRALAGEYATAAPMSTFLSRERNAPTNDLAMLHNARLVSVLESDEGARFAESIVKRLTGGDAVTARFLNCEFFTYVPQFKPWIATNHRPKVHDSSDGFWRRVKLVPFAVSFLGREDKTLLQVLRNELPGVLNWAVLGCLEWLKHGLGGSKSVSEATENYRAASDRVSAFTADCLQVGADLSITSSRLYELYAEWQQDHDSDEKPLSKKTLTAALLQRTGVAVYRTKEERGLTGIGGDR